MAVVRTVLARVGVLGVSGAGAADFLQRLTTQDVRLLTDGRLLYGAHLSAQGRLLFDFFMLRDGGEDSAVADERFLLISPLKEDVIPLAKALHGYDVTGAIEFENMSAAFELHCFFEVMREGASVDSLSDFWRGHQPLAASSTGVVAAGFDPREQGLGAMLLVRSGTELPAALAAVEVVADDVYEAHRVQCGVPLMTHEWRGKFLPAELNMESMGALSFSKGCYVGQEVTARMKYRTTARRVLAVGGIERVLGGGDVALHGDVAAAPLPVFGDVVRTVDGVEAGEVLESVFVAGSGLGAAPVHLESPLDANDERDDKGKRLGKVSAWVLMSLKLRVLESAAPDLPTLFLREGLSVVLKRVV